MNKLQKLDNTYLRMTNIWGLMSKAKRRKVGCIVVKNNQIISDGYNGTPSGFDNNCEYEENGKLITKPEVIHAESNALMKLATSTNSSIGATMYLSCAPCFQCAKLIIQAKINRVVYMDEYRNKDGINLLKNAKIRIEKYK